jgi:hypothetical protein
LAPNGIFAELFRTAFDGKDKYNTLTQHWDSCVISVCLTSDEILLKAIAYALNDYSAFDQMSPIAYLLEVNSINLLFQS